MNESTESTVKTEVPDTSVSYKRSFSDGVLLGALGMMGLYAVLLVISMFLSVNPDLNPFRRTFTVYGEAGTRVYFQNELGEESRYSLEESQQMILTDLRYDGELARVEFSRKDADGNTISGYRGYIYVSNLQIWIGGDWQSLESALARDLQLPRF